MKGTSPRVFTAVLISDIHMSNRLPHSKVGDRGVTDRLEDQQRLWKRVRKTARDHNAGAVFVLGDLFDKSLVDAITLTATVEAITALGRRTLILPGNHDAVNTRGGRFTVEAFGKMGNANIQYMDTGKRLVLPEAPWLGFWPMEYCDQETAQRTISNMQTEAHELPDRDSTTEVCMLHQSIVGCKHGDWKCDDGLDADELCREFDKVYAGHFHDHQFFGPDNKGMYLSAPLHLRFEDQGRAAGFWVVDFSEDGTVVQSFIDGGGPRFHTLEWPAVAVKAIKRMAAGDYVRVVCRATSADWVVEKPKLLEMIETLRANGLNAFHKHIPVYHHAARIKSASGMKDPTMNPEAMMEAYVDAADVDKGDLDPALLKRIGRDALASAKAKVA